MYGPQRLRFRRPFTSKGVSVDSKLLKKLALLITFGLAVALFAGVPATGKPTFKRLSQRALAHISGAPVTRYYAAHPELASPQMRATLMAMAGRTGTAHP